MLCAKIELPCINISAFITTFHAQIIYLCFMFIRQLETTVIKSILLDRYENAIFQDLRDFMKRIPISLEQLTILIRIDAFRFTRKNKKELLWDAHFILKKDKKTKPLQTLFNEKTKEFKIPEIYTDHLETT